MVSSTLTYCGMEYFKIFTNGNERVLEDLRLPNLRMKGDVAFCDYTIEADYDLINSNLKFEYHEH